MTTRTTPRQHLVAVLVVVLLVVTACGTRSTWSQRTANAPAVDVAAFGAKFDAGVGHRRLVLLMSPT